VRRLAASWLVREAELAHGVGLEPHGVRRQARLDRGLQVGHALDACTFSRQAQRLGLQHLRVGPEQRDVDRPVAERTLDAGIGRSASRSACSTSFWRALALARLDELDAEPARCCACRCRCRRRRRHQAHLGQLPHHRLDLRQLLAAARRLVPTGIVTLIWM
jgi:hypothetical protein